MAALPVFLPRESHGQRSLAGYSPWSHKESDTTEVTACMHLKKGESKMEYFFFTNKVLILFTYIFHVLQGRRRQLQRIDPT